MNAQKAGLKEGNPGIFHNWKLNEPTHYLWSSFSYFYLVMLSQGDPKFLILHRTVTKEKRKSRHPQKQSWDWTFPFLLKTQRAESEHQSVTLPKLHLLSNANLHVSVENLVDLFRVNEILIDSTLLICQTTKKDLPKQNKKTAQVQLVNTRLCKY